MPKICEKMFAKDGMVNLSGVITVVVFVLTHHHLNSTFLCVYRTRGSFLATSSALFVVPRRFIKLIFSNAAAAAAARTFFTFVKMITD